MASDDDNFRRTYLDVAVTLAADQTWTWNRNKTPFLLRTLSGPGALTLSGSGNIVFNAAVSAAVAVNGAIQVYLLSDGTFTTMPTWGSTAKIGLITSYAKGRDLTLADIFPLCVFANPGSISFGSFQKDLGYTNIVNTFTLSAEDAITGPGGSDRIAGMLRVQDAHVIQNGAALTGGSWFNLRTGTWTQNSGTTAFDYGAIIGRGPAHECGVQTQRLDLAGGTFKSRRLLVGLGNCDDVPAEMRVTGGTYEGTCLNYSADNLWATSLCLAPRSMINETKSDGNDFARLGQTMAYASGRLEITAGRVTTPGVIIGSPVAQFVDNHSGARLGLSGGRLEVGIGGLAEGVAWQETEERDPSWYEIELAGGTLAFTRSDVRSTAAMRLSNRAGGAVVEVPASVANVCIAGSLYGAGGLRKTGGGCLQLAGANDYTGRTDVVEGRLAVGDRLETAIWTGDSCGVTEDGAAVATWPLAAARSSASSWAFTHATSIPGTEGTTPPTLARGAVNGHDALAFNGAQTLFLTGNSAQPTSNRDAFTLAFVVQTEPGFTGAASTEVSKATQLATVSASMWNGEVGVANYGLSLDEQGRVGCGVFSMRVTAEDGALTTLPNENLWSTNSVNDGRPHVIVWSWRQKDQHVLRVDDQVYRLATTTNGVVTRRSRFVLGVGEQQASPYVRYKGYLADLRVVGSAVDDARATRLARELGVRYGVAAFADDTLWNTPTAMAEATVPAATARWTADALTQAAGEAVTAWPEDEGRGVNGNTWTFTRDLAEVILVDYPSKGYAGSTVSPVIAADTLAGHKLVSFDGRTMALALTGSRKTPVSEEAKGATVAIVMRATGRGTGGGAATSSTGLNFFGSGVWTPSTQEDWSLFLTGAGRAGLAHMTVSNNLWQTRDVRSRRRFLDNGEAHILVARLPLVDSGDTVALFVDGVKETANHALSGTFFRTRILLGASEVGGRATYAPIDVAEMRMWGGAVLSDDQVRALTAELAATYGLDVPELERGSAAEGQQRSADVYVHAGAEFGGIGSHGSLLYPGQTLWGEGAATGLLTLTPGAALKVTTAGAFTCGAGLELLDGAAFEIEGAGDAALQPIAVTGDVMVRGGLTLRLAADAKPSGAFLTWTGALRAAETPQVTFTGDAAKRFKVRFDLENKRAVLVPTGNTVILLR